MTLGAFCWGLSIGISFIFHTSLCTSDLTDFCMICEGIFEVSIDWNCFKHVNQESVIWAGKKREYLSFLLDFFKILKFHSKPLQRITVWKCECILSFIIWKMRPVFLMKSVNNRRLQIIFRMQVILCFKWVFRFLSA